VRQRIEFVLGAALALAVLSGCATSRPAIAPITTDQAAAPRPGKFVWRDLLTEDLDGVKRFYGELLGWEFTSTAIPHYTLIEYRGRPIGGIVDVAGRNSQVKESQWISLLSVPDVDAATRATTAAGGTVHVGPTDIAGRGRLAVVTDPQGAVIAYLRATGGDPPDNRPAVGEFLWTELWTADLNGSARFYDDLVSYDLEDEVILDDVDYVVFERNGVPRAGVIVRPIEKVPAHWLPYVRVEDPEALAARVEELGGQVILPPSEEIRKGTVTIVLDPAGAALALQKWSAS